MDPATVTLKQDCKDLDPSERSNRCSLGSQYYDGSCYKVMNTQYKFSEAEVACLPTSDSPYNSRMIWTEKLDHFDFVSNLVHKETGYLTFWIGLSDMEEDGFFTSR